MVNDGSDVGPYRTTHATFAVRSAATNHARRVLPIIIKLRSAGTLSLAKIANELQRRGVPTARGGHWHPMTVGRLLARRTLAGCPPTVAEVRAVHARSVRSLAQRLVANGFNNTAKLSLEFNRINKLTVTGQGWSVNSLGMYLKHHSRDIYDNIMSGAQPRSKQIEAAIDRIIQQGVLVHKEMAEALNNQCVPTLSARGVWTVDLVDNAVRRAHRKRIQTAIKSRIEQIKGAIERLTQRQVVTPSEIAKRLNQSGIPTLSGRARWSYTLVLYFSRKTNLTVTKASVEARIEQIETAIARLNPWGNLTYVEIAVALNNNGVPTLSGRAEWNKDKVYQFLRKLGRSGTRTELKAKVECIRSALNGIVRRRGKMSATRIADELNKSDVRTLSGKGAWTAKRVRFLYLRLGRVKKPRFWTRARVARVRELHQSGETAAAIADEFIDYDISEHAVWSVLRRAKDPAYPKRRRRRRR
jgi:Recombinase